jgi:hypothetical protein
LDDEAAGVNQAGVCRIHRPEMNANLRRPPKELNMDDFWIPWLPWLPFVVFFAWLLFFGRGARKACPDCNQPLPLFQSPFTKTKRQWFEGGYVCPNCGCETDIRGRKVPPGTGPQWPSVIIYIGVLTLAVGLAIVLITAIVLPTGILAR